MDNRLLLLALLPALCSCQFGGFDTNVKQVREETFELHTDEAKNIRPRAFQQQQAHHQLLNQNDQAGGGNNNRGKAHISESASEVQQLRKHFPIAGLESYQNLLQIKPVAPQQQQQQVRRPVLQAQREALEEDDDELAEKEEPDRLSQLLQDSKFDCVSRNTGYYADEGLACEVFHYCQDNTKHSWICPDGFTFHQVHLICMPPSSDNICQKSSQYHFVNDYLYKPVNAEEVQQRPNISLRYSDRFYPSEVYHDGRYDEEDGEQAPPPPRRQPTRPPPLPILANHNANGGNLPSRRPQVFRSPEEVDIPLIQRRPAHIPQPFHPSPSQDFDFDRK